MDIFSCSQIYKSYQTGCLQRSKKEALSGVSLTVEEHEVFGIIGLNGAGKSSLLKIFMGFISPDSGTATIAGRPVQAKDCHRSIGYLPEHPSLYSHLSIKEHLQFGCRIAGIPAQEAEKKIRTSLQRVDLVDVEKMPIKGFSKGMTQRAALAYAILLEPKILVLDEPMSGLDPLGRQMVLDIIEEYHSRGTTILFCSHILTDVERVCNRIGIMDKGRMTSVITADSLTNNQDSPVSISSQTPLEHYFLNTVRNRNS